ncbi:MAG TPA: glycosyltransferase family 39 protein [bacterium]|nr:glycosyltransferase family 39 protein [bacterium]
MERIKGDARYNLKNLLFLTAVLKVLVLLVIAAGAFLFPFNSANYYANFTYPFQAPPDLWTHYKTWDGQIYLYLSQEGYRPGHMANAFYPLFPFLIKIMGRLLGGNDLLAALLISHLLTFGAMAYLFLIFRETLDAREAFLACLFILTFPTAFFMGLIYTESLFLCLIGGLWFHARRGDWKPALFFAFLLPLTRPTGILLIPPLMVLLWERGRAGGRRAASFSLGGILLGFLTYLGLMRYWTGDPFASFAAQKYFVGNFSVGHFFQPWGVFLHGFFNLGEGNIGLECALLNRVLFLGLLTVLVAGWRSMGRAEWVYLAVMVLVPALSGNLIPYSRYALVLFPFFAFLARRWSGREGIFLAASTVLQVILALEYSLDYYIS